VFFARFVVTMDLAKGRSWARRSQLGQRNCRCGGRLPLENAASLTAAPCRGTLVAPSGMSFRLRICIALPLAACSAPPPPPPLPVLSFAVHYFAGPALSGRVAPAFLPVQSPPPAGAGAMPLLAAELFELPGVPATAAPLALCASLVVRAPVTQPFASHPRALTGIHLVQGDAAASLHSELASGGASLATASVPLPAGASTALDIEAGGQLSELPHCLFARELGAAAVRVALSTPAGEEQVLLTQAPAAGGPPLVLCLPASALLPAFALVVHVSAEPAAEQEGTAAVAAVEAAAQAATLATTVPERSTQMLRAHAELLQHLVQAEDRRCSLLALAQRVGAVACADFAVSAGTAALARLCTSLDTFDATAGEAAQRFQLERGCLQVLLPALQRDEVPPEEAAFLLRWCGAVGRRAARLQDVLDAVTSCDDLAARLLAENRSFLRENDPAGRVHAYDWLLARGQAPPGFDPLGSREQRRQALEAAEPEAGR
jgi:hypothetical protein